VGCNARKTNKQTNITTKNRALLSAVGVGLWVMKRWWENNRELAALPIATEILKLCGYSVVCVTA
jgi:hypothetical protein